MRIGFYATLRKIVGEKYVELPIDTPCPLQSVLDAVLEAHPELRDELLDEQGGLDRYVHLFVDGRSSKFLPDGLATRVDETHTIEFFPAVAGG